MGQITKASNKLPALLRGSREKGQGEMDLRCSELSGCVYHIFCMGKYLHNYKYT